MTEPFFSSVTRISDLEGSPLKTDRLPQNEWAMGDYVVCEVVGRPGPLYQVERPSGRMCQVFDGDYIVGAFGTRAATLEGVGDWRDIGDDGKLHALTPAGLFGKATSVSAAATDEPSLRRSRDERSQSNHERFLYIS